MLPFFVESHLLTRKYHIRPLLKFANVGMRAFFKEEECYLEWHWSSFGRKQPRRNQQRRLTKCAKHNRRLFTTSSIDMLNPNDLTNFLCDPHLIDLIERVKISDDVLDVVSLTETQHSSMLAWCVNPNEGHGQGDAVLKDFLTAAYVAGAETNRFANREFFEKWTPGQIRTASFGSAFIACEFSLQADESNKRKRLDLFIIDPGNKLVITIENKYGASLTDEQLSAYYERVSEQIARRPIFRDDKYNFLYVVVDRDLDDYDEEHLKGLGNKWALLDYTWLKSAAKRARLHVERNNQSAQLLMAYCQHQTGWQSSNDEHISELAAELATQHEVVVDHMRQYWNFKPTDWTPTSFRGAEGELLIFIQQQRQLCDHLLLARGIGAVRVGLRKVLPEADQQYIEFGRTRINFATRNMVSLIQSTDGYWPVYLNIYRDKSASDDGSKFTLRLIWSPAHFDDPSWNSDNLRELFANRFAGLKQFAGRSIRRLTLGEKLGAKAVVKLAGELAAEIDRLIEIARRDGVIQ